MSALDPIHKQKSGLKLHIHDVSSNVGLFVVDGQLECSVAIAARQIVSETW